MSLSTVTLHIDKPFEVEFSGNAESDTIIILVHGFGVKRNSRGLFTDIVDAFSEEFLIVNGDFSEIHDDSTYAIPISTQAKRLTEIITYVKDKYYAKKFIFIGHSQGCLVIAQAHTTLPINSTILLLAPPIIDPANRFAATPGWQRNGSYINEKGRSVLNRSDLTITVGPDYWQDFHDLPVDTLYEQLSQDPNVHIIFAENDEVLGKQQSPFNILSNTVHNADHDFSGSARKELLKLLIQILN